MHDEELRTSMFLALDVLRAQFGPDVPWVELQRGFGFRGRRVPFFNKTIGIYRAKDAQRGPAALTINSAVAQRRYHDESTPEGVLYRYQDGRDDNHYNRWLRSAAALGVPLAYFIGTRPGWYSPEYPVYVHDLPAERRVLVTFGKMIGPYDEREPVEILDPIQRGYRVSEVRRRIHQTRFRGAVIPAYADRCAICRLRAVRLLDAAHIVGDADERGEPRVANGLSLCTIHHRAYDQDLVGVSPDREVHVSRALLDDDDGPMLDLLKTFHGQPLTDPSRAAHRPDRALLAIRFERFRRAGG